MMRNPKIAAAVCGAVALWLIYGMATATEQPSTALMVLQWVMLAGVLLGFVDAVRRLAGGNADGPS